MLVFPQGRLQHWTAPPESAKERSEQEGRRGCHGIGRSVAAAHRPGRCIGQPFWHHRWPVRARPWLGEFEGLQQGSVA
jgi:hypothetical protein